MYRSIYFKILSMFVVACLIAYSQCKSHKKISYYASLDEKDLISAEKPVKMEWKGFQDPIRLARERFRKKSHFSFRSADSRPIADSEDEEAAAPTAQIESGASCAGGSCRASQEQVEQKRVEWLKKTVLQKLKLSAPPNVTTSRKIPPNSPVMRALLKEYGIDQMKAHQIDDDMEDEIKSQKLISTAREGKMLLRLLQYARTKKTFIQYMLENRYKHYFLTMFLKAKTNCR